MALGIRCWYQGPALESLVRRWGGLTPHWRHWEYGPCTGMDQQGHWCGSEVTGPTPEFLGTLSP